MPFTEDGIWKPDGIKQEQFLALPNTIREALIGGGVNTGKTELLLMYGVAKKWHLMEGFKQVYARRKLTQIRDEVVPRSKRLFGRLKGWKYNETFMHWTYEPTGAMIFFAHCENESDVHNYDTMEINLFTPDELTSWTEWMYLYIALERVRRPTNNPDLPWVTRAAAMPGDIGHTWVNNRFVKPHPQGGKIILSKAGNKRIYIHTTLMDSEKPNLEYAKQLEDLPEAEKKAKRDGDWNSYQGQVFSEFRNKHYPDEPENALHVIEPFDIPAFWPKIFVNDWGNEAMNYVLSLAISPSKRVYAYRERWWLKTKIAHWAPYIKEDILRENPRTYVLCRSAKQDRGQEHTVQSEIEKELGISVELANNGPHTRIPGKQLLHEYLRWKPRYVPSAESREYDEEYAMWLFRNRGLEEYKSYLHSFRPIDPETNIPKLLIFNTLEKLPEAIQSCVHDEKNPEDVAEFVGDDPYDTIRYGLDRCDKFFDEAKAEFEKLQKQEELVQKFAATGDYNMFFRKPIIVGNQTGIAGLPMPVRRYHH